MDFESIGVTVSKNSTIFISKFRTISLHKTDKLTFDPYHLERGMSWFTKLHHNLYT